MKKLLLKMLGFSSEEIFLFESIVSARKIQDYLWGEFHKGGINLEEWKRMFKKRIVKIDDIKPDNPHGKVELKKRVLQNAALSIRMLNEIDRDGINEERAIVSNLPQYATGKC